VRVHVVGELDEAEAVAEHPVDAPGQVRRVDRQAVPADARPGREAHVPERLGRRRVDRGPDVDSEVPCEHRELVDQRDVDVAERVLEELDELRLARGPDGNDLVDERAVERLDRAARRLVHSCDDLGRVDEAPRRVAGVDPFR
jgi:hypothetical protein